MNVRHMRGQYSMNVGRRRRLLIRKYYRYLPDCTDRTGVFDSGQRLRITPADTIFISERGTLDDRR